MCGIFGIICGSGADLNNKRTNNIVKDLFKLSESRGKESSGIAIKNTWNKQISILKKSLSASKLIKTKEYRDFFKESTIGLFSYGDNNEIRTLPFSIIAHARLVTNGSQENDNNNQPCIKSGGVVVHNGIITNVDELWERHTELQRDYEVDSEILLSLIRNDYEVKKYSLASAIKNAYNKIEGTASIAIINYDTPEIALATNNGSLYYIENEESKILIFASEKFILQELIKRQKLLSNGLNTINLLRPNEAFILNYEDFTKTRFNLVTINEKDALLTSHNTRNEKYEIKNYSADKKIDIKLINTNFTNISAYAILRDKLEYNIDAINRIKRCNKCLLPETFPYLTFDEAGVCSYCNNYQPQKHLGINALQERADKIRSSDGKPDCLVMFSGGRDSSYGLHFIKKELNLNPIAYTYDWGMVTDLARRNQARICGKLGVEHILVSADISYKRKNISKNVAAWLKRPRLGTVPLFMAGDKQFFYYANYLSKINNLKVILMCENMLETTSFKSGFAGIQPNFGKDHNYYISFPQKMKMLTYYAKEFLFNPAYINSSLFDTLGAFKSYYFISHQYFNIFNYFPWIEDDVEQTLFKEYNWETSPDTSSTWRIGDGTAAFYNYIYYTVAGFSEFDTFRSNQIREGLITREEALGKINLENQPRFESLKWYLDTINISYEKAVDIINAIPKLYSL